MLTAPPATLASDEGRKLANVYETTLHGTDSIYLLAPA